MSARPRLLVSALSCAASHGSEALVGFKYAGLFAQEYDVEVLSARPAEQPAGARLHELDCGPMHFNEIPWEEWRRFERAQLRCARSLAPFDAVFHVTPSASYFPSLLTRFGVPIVTGPVLAAPAPPPSFVPWMHRQVAIQRVPRWNPGRLYRALLYRVMNRHAQSWPLLRRAKFILSGSESTTRMLPDDVRCKVMTVKYAGVEHAQFTPPEKRTVAATTRLLYVGRVIPYKGVELLLRATAVVARQMPVALDIVGGADPAYLEFCQSLALELGIADKVTFHARIPRHELLRFYQGCTVFCFPSLSETYGVALLEAMSCACACVVPDNSGPGEILPKGCGIRVPLRDPEQAIADFSAAIIELARRPELRFEYGSAARRHVVAQHDWDRILDSVRTALAANLFPTST